MGATIALHSNGVISLFLLSILAIILTNPAHLCHGCYTRMFIFGDLLTDTGNYYSMTGIPGYGETYFHKVTGRWSNGRVWTDFIVAGATAMNHSFFRERGIPVLNPVVGFLELQIQWFKQLLTLLCPQSDCRNIVESSLFIVGEFGVNDYNLPATSLSVPFDEICTFVPYVIQAIGEGVKELIDLGAKTLVLPYIIVKSMKIMMMRPVASSE